jgi:hypothetical protein
MYPIRHSRKTTAGYAYSWGNMPIGAKKLCASPIDALLEVLAQELQIKSIGRMEVELGIEHSQISRCRHGQAIPHIWLLRATVVSGIPYDRLCGIIGEEPQYYPHPNAWKGKDNELRA